MDRGGDQSFFFIARGQDGNYSRGWSGREPWRSFGFGRRRETVAWGGVSERGTHGQGGKEAGGSDVCDH